MTHTRHRIIAAETSILEATAAVTQIERIVRDGLDPHPENYDVLGTVAANLHRLKNAATIAETLIIEAMKRCKP